MSDWLLTVGIVQLAITGVMLLLWLVSLVKRDVSIVDIFWGAGFVFVAWIALALAPSLTTRSWLLVGLTSLWGLRLAGYLFWRKRHEGEDRRYGAMREYHGERFWWVSLITVFMFQALLMGWIALPVQIALAKASDTPLGALDLLGALLWCIGFLCETIGDAQLMRFKADPANKGRVMDRGLWRYTRHPNYFGDATVWWGLYLIATAGGAGGTVLSPLVMTLLLLKVSGVALLEQTITDRRPDYAAYKARTSSFFPWPPRH